MHLTILDPQAGSRHPARESSWRMAPTRSHPALLRWFLCCALPLLAYLPVVAHASMFKGEALDTASDVLAWVVLIAAPIIGIAVFLLVHILPEKIAEKRKHPQAKVVQVLCILSLFFGGLLWPLAWLLAYTKPVLYKIAYGTDQVEPEHGAAKGAPAEGTTDADELKRLRTQVAELEARLAGNPATERKKD
jgi:CBS domain containing-hemolysin-like protein